MVSRSRVRVLSVVDWLGFARGPFWLCWVLLTASSVAAQLPPTDPPGGAAAEKPKDTPPKLKKFVEATHPPAALEQGLTARVEVELVVGTDGLVKDAKVVTPVGSGFDEAALEAVRQFEFEPATRDGQPMAARIRYAYEFVLKQPEPPPPEPEAPPPPGRLEGVVLDADGGGPVPGAVVAVRGATGDELRAQTDAAGRFGFDALQAGMYRVVVTADDMLPSDQQEEVRSGEITELTYRLQEPVDQDAFEAVARIPPPPREVTRRTIGKQQLTRIPGTRGDALRTVELMPGVARPPLGSGLLIVRGSAPNDTQALFEGLPVPLLYHFGGLTSFINSRLLESIEFYPGNFSVRYGRRRGGIIEIAASEIPRDSFHGVADINVIDASLLLSAPLGEDAEIALAGRRSHFHVLLGSALEDEDLSTVAAPVYYDYQAIGSFRPSDADKVRLMVYGSSDEFALLFEEPDDSDAAVSGDFDIGTQFHRAHGSWRRKLSPRVDQDIDLSVGRIDLDVALGEAFDFNLSGTDVFARGEWRGRVSDTVRLIGGLDVAFFPGEYRYLGPPPGQTENNPSGNAGGGTFSNRDQISARGDFEQFQPAVYLESGLTLDPFGFSLGNRVDYFREIDAFVYDPRGSAYYDLTDTTRLKSGIGLFSQPPEFQESDADLGNPDLKPPRTLHVSAGVEQRFVDDALNVSLEGFYKHLYERVVGTPLGQPPFFLNAGEGRVFGLEFAVRAEPHRNLLDGRFFGYLSYTLSRSERKDPEDGYQLFDFDQTHILTTAVVFKLGSGWEAGVTFRVVSGNLDTPVVGSNQNVITGNFSPVFGRTNSIRNPMFNQLDVRIEKQWDFEAWKLALYLDVLNAYNRENSEGTVHDFEYREREQINGLPIIPNLGLRGEI